VTDDGIAPNPLGRRDAEAMIGVLALLEGHLINGDLAPHVVDRLSERLVGPGAGAAELRVALANLNQRLRYVLGEHENPPAISTGHVDLYVGFPSEAGARAFTEAVPSAGTPVAVDGRAYDDGTVRWEVAVRSTTRTAAGPGPPRRHGELTGRLQPTVIRPSTAASAMSVRQCAPVSRIPATRS